MDEGFERHLVPGADVALVAFGSFTNANRPAPAYGFVQTCRDAAANSSIPFDTWYFLSERNDWYHRGARGIGETVEASASSLTRYLARYRRRIFVGNSMGGYAALLFGVLARAESIIAFSPQTRLDAEFLDSIHEDRWSKALCVLNRDFPRRTINIHEVIADAAEKPNISIYVGAECEQDLAQARNLLGLEGVEILEEAGQGHDLVHDLKASGRLQEIIVQSVEAR